MNDPKPPKPPLTLVKASPGNGDDDRNAANAKLIEIIFIRLGEERELTGQRFDRLENRFEDLETKILSFAQSQKNAARDTGIAISTIQKDIKELEKASQIASRRLKAIEEDKLSAISQRLGIVENSKNSSSQIVERLATAQIEEQETETSLKKRRWDLVLHFGQQATKWLFVGGGGAILYAVLRHFLG